MKPRRKLNIAIADGQVIFREGLSEILLKRFNDIEIVIQASNGRELINKIGMNEKLPDICILDVEMPELNGFETLVEINKQWPLIRFLILSLYENEFTILKMLQYGANGYLSKSCNLTELHQALVNIYDSAYHHSNIISNTLLSYLKNKKKMQPMIDISKQEIEFLSYCCTDITYKEIASKMNVSLRTIEGYQESLSAKLNIHSRVGLAVFSVQTGIYKKN